MRLWLPPLIRPSATFSPAGRRDFAYPAFGHLLPGGEKGLCLRRRRPVNTLAAQVGQPAIPETSA